MNALAQLLASVRGRSRVLGIELSDEEARVVELARQGEKLAKVAHARADFEGAADAAARGARLREALDAAGIATRDAAVSLPRHQVILREVELPAAERTELRSMVRLKVERELPFPAEQMAWGIRVLSRRGPGSPGESSASAAGKVRVLAAFVKRDLLERALAVLAAAGLEAVEVGVSALYAIRAFQLSASFVPGQPQGLVAAGRRMTEIAVLNGTTSLLSRSASTGLERVLPAEGAGPGEEQLFLDEVARTFHSFHGGTEPIRAILLADLGAGREELKALLAARFGVPVETLRPFQSPRLAEPSSFEEDWLFATALGAAAGHLAGAEEVDFLPPRRRLLEGLSWSRRAAAIALGVAALAALYVLPPILFARMEQGLGQLRGQQLGLAQDAKGFETYRKKVETLAPWADGRTSWVEVLARLSREIDTKKLFLSSLTLRDTGKPLLVLTGKAKSSEDCFNLVERLNRDPAFRAHLKPTSKARIDRTGYSIDFTIEVGLVLEKLKKHG